MKRKRLAVLASIFLLVVVGFYVIRHFYWLMYPGLPVYP
jgi:hypothetical protein